VAEHFDREVTSDNYEEVFASATAQVALGLARDFWKIHVTCDTCGDTNWGTGWIMHNLVNMGASRPSHRYGCSQCRTNNKRIDRLVEITE
jgi:hypothetical protein